MVPKVRDPNLIRKVGKGTSPKGRPQGLLPSTREDPATFQCTNLARETDQDMHPGRRSRCQGRNRPVLKGNAASTSIWQYFAGGSVSTGSDG